MCKIEFRKKYKTLRQNLDVALKEKIDKAIAKNVTYCKQFNNAETVLAFVSNEIEVDTVEIINRAFEVGKKVAVPLCNVQRLEMDFYYINSFDDLEIGAYKILEPKKSLKKVKDFSKSICLVPGLVYNEKGYRIGFGKGYYDKFLKGYTGVSIGLCYEDCIDNQISVEQYDIAVDLLITENNIIDIG